MHILSYRNRTLSSPPQTPILSYSAHNPHQVFVTSVLSATIVMQPQFLDIIVEIDQLIYLYAKVIKHSLHPGSEIYV